MNTHYIVLTLVLNVESLVKKDVKEHEEESEIASPKVNARTRPAQKTSTTRLVIFIRFPRM